MWGRMVAWGLRRCARACGAQTLGRSNGYFNKQHPARALSLVRACSLFLCMYVCMDAHVCMCASVHVCMHVWMDGYGGGSGSALQHFHCRMQGALPERFSGNLRLLRLLMGDGSGMHAMSGRCHRNKGIIDGIVEWRRRWH